MPNICLQNMASAVIEADGRQVLAVSGQAAIRAEAAGFEEGDDLRLWPSAGCSRRRSRRSSSAIKCQPDMLMSLFCPFK